MAGLGGGRESEGAPAVESAGGSSEGSAGGSLGPRGRGSDVRRRPGGRVGGR